MTTAMDTALAAIDRAFSPAARIEMHKRHVRRLMRLASGHPKIWTRYQRLAERYPTCSIEVAIVLVERMYRAELRLRDEAIRLWGRCSRPRMALMLLQEARVVLRWMRRFDRASFAEVRRVIIMPELVKEAAE
jgi:hypothetical protein